MSDVVNIGALLSEGRKSQKLWSTILYHAMPYHTIPYYTIAVKKSLYVIKHTYYKTFASNFSTYTTSILRILSQTN